MSYMSLLTRLFLSECFWQLNLQNHMVRFYFGLIWSCVIFYLEVELKFISISVLFFLFCSAKKNNAESTIERLRTEIGVCRSQLAEVNIFLFDYLAYLFILQESGVKDELLSITTKLGAVEGSQKAGSVDQKLSG